MQSVAAGCECPRGIRRLRTGDEFRHSKVSALSASDRIRYWALALLWLAVNLAFWGWWLRQTGHRTPWLY